ncbi:tetratricopeptide repeat protein [Lutibacter sp. Hel_I_33_5]|uniref:tetratricopeptide repeat-containing sensor histidine kinase n=1 Tax=Lutibacter sp. Hel_I_33_5 TaxID=1566289 RepID=UPI0011A2C3A3|nr:tetratricopeptide repeat-containing sensor histidine kinase [Lutibacter sp. Hel_I_33_5]TVZ56952.1 tetratricopeptide repeat protein [Lutibacter sp. Hel_I_33_5]
MKKLTTLIFISFAFVVSSQESIHKKDSTEIEEFIKKSVDYRRKFKLDSSIIFSTRAIELAREKKQTELLGRALMREGITYYEKTNYDTALEKYNEAIVCFEKVKDTSSIASTYANLGSLHSQQNKLKEAMTYFFKAIDLYKKLDSPKREIISLFNISLISFRQKLYDQSAEYCYEIQKIIKENNFGTYLNTNIENQLGNIFYTDGNLEKATYHFERTLQFSKEKKDIRRQVLSLVNLGAIYLDTNQLNKAEKSYKEALDIMNSIEATLAEKAVVYIGLGDTYYKKKQYNKAISFTNKGLEQAKSQKQTEFERDANKVLAKIYAATKSYKNAYNHVSDFKILADSLSNNSTTALVKDIETKYQTQQKENKILKLENESQLQEIKLQKSSFNTKLSFAGLLLVLISGLFWIHRRKKQQQLDLLQTSIKSTEEEKRRIGRELHDGIASNLIKLSHKTEVNNVALSHELLDSYNEIRGLSHQLNNTSIEGELFINRLLDVFPEDTDSQKFDQQVSPISLSLIEPYSTHSFRIIQELIANNIKYADANHTNVSIKLDNNLLSIVYKDDGKGVKKIKKGNGLKNIEDRITLMNGSFNIETEENDGFKIIISIPYNS